jgi:AraC-like DNA-binding protein
MHPVGTPRLLFDRVLVDADQFGDEAGWDVEIRQLESGALNATETVMGTPQNLAVRGEFNRGLHQAGQPPAGMLTFGIPDAVVGDFRWCSKNACGEDLLNFNLANGFEGVTSAGFAGYTLSFDEVLLRDVIDILELDIDLSAQVLECSLWSGLGAVSKRLRERLDEAFRASRICDYPEAADLFEFSAAAFVLQMIAGGAGHPPPGVLSKRRAAVRRALNWLQHHDKLPLTVSDLCRHAGVSAPTLYRGFQEEFGVGPKRYLQIRRLAGVRSELLADGRGSGVTDIANRWGFWHMGQFAADYHRQFGELPSATPKRASRQVRY